jgi:formylmethanofuran dehydrogenase subunit E
MGFTINEDLGIGELSPGSTERRWEPEGGVGRHREKIHRESRHADEFKNLPFKFSKPRKAGRRHYVKCVKCGEIFYVSVNTVGIVCKNCNAYVSVEEV